MKNLRISILFLAAGLIACQKTDQLPDQPQKRISSDQISVTLPEGFSAVDGSSLKAYQIEGKSFDYILSQPANPAVFKYSGEGEAPQRIAYAVYCGAPVDSLYRGRFYARIPDEQKVEGNGLIDPDAYLFIGHVTDKQTVPAQLFGYLQFTVDQTDVNLCQIFSSDGGILAGPVKIEMKDTPVITAASNSTKSVSLQGNLEKGKTYRVAVYPGLYSAFTVSFKNAYGVQIWEKNLTGDYQLAPGETVDLGSFGNPNVSSLELSASTSEFDGYLVKSIVGYSEATEKRILGGDVNKVFKSGEPLVANFFGLEPEDYSSSRIWFVFTMEKDARSIVLPIATDGFSIPAASKVSKNIGEVKESLNAAPWYYPYEDKRHMCAPGYAFGDANTYLIQCKTATYSGAVDPDPNIPSSVTIDYRVRGDLFGAPRPTDVTFEWAQGYGGSGTWGILTPDRSKGQNSQNFSFSVDAEHYKVTVTNNNAYVGAPLLLMKKGDKILWAWAFWNIAADGTRFTPVNMGGVKIAPLDIGQCSTVDQSSKVISKITELRRSTYYYQWGRSTPIFWQNTTKVYVSKDDPRNITGSRMLVADTGAITPEEGLQHPGAVIMNEFKTSLASDALNDWIKGGAESNYDLWGGPAAKDALTGTGTKSIMDPCPKGWRVADAKTYNDVFPGTGVSPYDLSQYPIVSLKGYNGVYATSDAVFTCSGNLGTSINNTGAVGNNGFGAGTATCKENGFVWTNTFMSGTTCYVFKADYYYEKHDNATVYANRGLQLKNKPTSVSCAVRCQIDEDNR